MVEERVKAMKDYLLGIVSVQDTPLPHLKCHQALLLPGGYQKNLKPVILVAEIFSYYIIADVMHHLDNVFKARPKSRKGFVPLLACLDTFIKYDLPDIIPD